MVSDDGQHVYGVEGIATGQRKDALVTRMRPCADISLAITKGLKEVLATLENQGEFGMEAIHAVALSTDSEELI